MPTYAGTCPTLVQAPTENTITSSGNARQFLFVSPPDMKPNEKLPLVFTWHWLKSTAQDFVDKAAIVAATQQQRFIAVSPEAKGDLLWNWPFAVSDPPQRMAEEVQFFLDMLACVTQQVPQVNTACISSAGVSAGALFTSQLGAAHSDLLASMIVMSGGVGGGLVQPMPAASRALPAIVLWGGPTDQCSVLDFAVTTRNLESSLDQAGSFFVECEHNCGHAQPPFTAPTGMTEYAAFWDFIYEHPMWTTPGASPYKAHGLPSSFPSWCSAAGEGTAVERTGSCPPPACSGL
jgi:poly(3-hydroxybutyrate) depolymerase